MKTYVVLLKNRDIVKVVADSVHGSSDKLRFYRSDDEERPIAVFYGPDLIGYYDETAIVTEPALGVA